MMSNAKMILKISKGPDLPALKVPSALENLTVIMDRVFSLPRTTAPVRASTSIGNSFRNHGKDGFAGEADDKPLSSDFSSSVSLEAARAVSSPREPPLPRFV